MIGIIGGNGVAATNRLCQLVEEKITKAGAFRDSHHPEMIIWQATQAPSRSMYLEGRGPSWIDDYVHVGLKLKECGCDELCMCCNTAHYAVDELSRKIGLPFINLLNEVCKVIKDRNFTRIGLMVTDGARKYRLYDKSLEKIFPEASFVYPDEKFQQLVTLGICNAKNEKRFLSIKNPESPTALFEKVCNHLIRKGCDSIVAGCTDISNVFHPESIEDCVVVDSLNVLADYIKCSVK